MSSSTKSKPESASSPPTGPATETGAGAIVEADDTDGDDGDDDDDDELPAGSAHVELEMIRQRYVSWVIGGIAIGGLLVWKLGTVGVWVGVALIVIGVLHGLRLIQTLMYPPGEIIVDETSVSLPRGLCKPGKVEAKRADVRAVYFLRRSVPWNTTAPVLVIEIGDRAHLFPRDWFASEADQRHVVHALMARSAVKAA